MPRRREVPKRKTLPDPRFGDPLVTKFMNCLMEDGKKSVAEKIVYGSFDIIHTRTREDPVAVFRKAIDNVKPMVEVKSRRVGGASYQVPVEIRPVRQIALALRWIKDSASSRSGKSMRERLAAELIDAASNNGAAVKKRDETHRMAEANRAFAHYRW